MYCKGIRLQPKILSLDNKELMNLNIFNSYLNNNFTYNRTLKRMHFPYS